MFEWFLSLGIGQLSLLDGVAVPLKEQVCSLWVLIDPALSLEAQVSSASRSTFYQLWPVSQLQPFPDRDSLATVVCAVVTSRLDCCNVIYLGLPLNFVRNTQLV